MISEHISDKEGVYSRTALRLGIKNKPNKQQLNNMVKWKNTETTHSSLSFKSDEKINKESKEISKSKSFPDPD